MITSTKNIKVKEIRHLQGRSKNRREMGKFVVEGVRLIEEAVKVGWTPTSVLYSEELSERGFELVRQIQSLEADVEVAEPHVLQYASDTKNPQGIIAVIPMKEAEPTDDIDFVLVTDQIRDPGNLGTLLRTASAAGVQAVFIPPGTADVFSPKVPRSAMGAHFKISIQQGDYSELAAICKTHHLSLHVAEVSGGTIYHQTDLSKPLALVIGGEANWVSPEILALEPSPIHIPMPGKSESLNAAIAGAVLLFEVARQRASQ